MTRERHPWNRRHLLAGGGATALISAAARADAKPIRGKPSRNIVLVHGAFADGSCWSEVIVRLRAKGYNVSAVQCPLTSLADDVKATRRVLDRQTGPVILVGHSWGGTVITEAGEAPNVEGLVYVSALAPDAGEAVVDLQKHGPASDGMKGARPDGDGFLWFDHEAYAHGMAADVPRQGSVSWRPYKSRSQPLRSVKSSPPPPGVTSPRGSSRPNTTGRWHRSCSDGWSRACRPKPFRFHRATCR